MNISTAIKQLRSELGVTQMELANILSINPSTVCRWEWGKTVPSRSMTAFIIRYAGERGVSQTCIENFSHAVSNARRIRFDKTSDELHTADGDTLMNIINGITFPLYVCDYETYEILYINKKSEELSGFEFKDIAHKKCYECLMHRTSPCENCYKNMLTEERFTGFDSLFPLNGIEYRVNGRIINWNGRKAIIRYVSGEAKAVSEQFR